MKSQDPKSIMDGYYDKTRDCVDRYHFIKAVRLFIQHVRFDKISDAENVYEKISEDFKDKKVPTSFLNKLIEDTIVLVVNGLSYDQAREAWYRNRHHAADNDFIICRAIAYRLTGEMSQIIKSSTDPRITADVLRLIDDIERNGFEGTVTDLRIMARAKLKAQCKKANCQQELYRIYDIVPQVDRQFVMSY